MIESILDRASANQYGYAVRDVRNYESLAGQLPEDVGIEGHDAFMAPCARSTVANLSSGNSFVKAPDPEAPATFVRNQYTGSLEKPRRRHGSLLDGNIIVCHANTPDADQRPFACPMSCRCLLMELMEPSSTRGRCRPPPGRS